MFSCVTKTTLSAAAAIMLICGPAMAIGKEEPRCAGLEKTVLPAPDWYAARCLAGNAVTDYSQYEQAEGLVPGDTAFYKTHFPTPLALKTAPLATLTFTTVGPNAQPLFAIRFNPAATILYAIDNTSRQLGTLNQATGAFTAIAAINPDPGPAFTIVGLTFDPMVPADAYVIASDGTATGSRLYRINVTTAALTLVGTITNAPLVVDVVIDNSGQMFSHDISNDTLIRINKTTAAPTLVGSTGLSSNFAQGLMYDPTDDTLYGCSYVIAPAMQGQLVRFSKTTGAATVVAGPVPDEMECAIRLPIGVTLSAAPQALAVDTAGNGVYQPNETVVVAPTWSNTGNGVITLTGALTNHTGPAGPVYTIPDPAATYGTIAVGASGTCATGGNCYSVANATASRPVTHWDSTATETVSPTGATKTWTLHIGDSFTDVLAGNPFYRFVETILHKNVTGGCTPTTYCPSASTTREQMAVFVLVAKEPAGYVPPACGATPRFTDVPANSPFCRWVEELARRNVVNGCTATTYCPTATATREQMAVFVLRTLDPTLNPPACGTPMFGDVPASSPFCKWIEELVRRNVVTGCGGGNYCPTDPVTREQMAVFLTVTFGLTLYGL